MTLKRLWAAMGAYALFSLFAFFTLDGKLLSGVWILMGALALKTLIAYKAEQIRNREREP